MNRFTTTLRIAAAMMIVIILFGCSGTLVAQSVAQSSEKPPQELNLWERYVLGKDVPPKQPSVIAELYPVFLFSGGFGANIGYGTGHWEFGATYITVPLMDAWRDWFFADAAGVNVQHNTAFELFANYFIRSDRQGFYVGVIGGPEWYDVRDKGSAASETLMRAYIVPRVGVRWFPFQPFFYLDTSFGASFNISGSEVRQLGKATYSARSVLAIPFIQIGASIPLGAEIGQ